MDAKYVALLVADEGTRLTVYDDANGRPIVPGHMVYGHPTIGIGRALDTHGISDEEAQYLLRNDIAAIEAKLTETFDFYPSLSSGRQYVLVNMAFNLGFGGLLGFPKMLEAIRAQNWVVAKAELLNSKAARQLPARYGRLAAILLNDPAT